MLLTILLLGSLLHRQAKPEVRMREFSENQKEIPEANRAICFGVTALFVLFALLLVCLSSGRAQAAEALPARVNFVGTGSVVNADLIYTEPATATPEPTATPGVTGEPTKREKLKTIAAEKYALGVILAGCISIGILIVLFRYWTRRSGGHKE